MDIIQVITDNPQYAKKIIKILEKGILDIKNGSATLHFNNDSVLMDIDVHLKAYNYKKEPY